MDRIEFVHSINSNTINTSDLFINYFDQSMLLYSLVPEDSKVMVSNNSLNSISFTIASTKNKISTLSKSIGNMNVFRPYRKQLVVKCTQENNNTLNITMINP